MQCEERARAAATAAATADAAAAAAADAAAASDAAGADEGEGVAVEEDDAEEEGPEAAQVKSEGSGDSEDSGGSGDAAPLAAAVHRRLPEFTPDFAARGGTDLEHSLSAGAPNLRGVRGQPRPLPTPARQPWVDHPFRHGADAITRTLDTLGGRSDAAESELQGRAAGGREGQFWGLGRAEVQVAPSDPGMPL